MNDDVGNAPRRLRGGFTTGTCAAAAAKAAAIVLCGERDDVREVEVALLDGTRETLPVESVGRVGEQGVAVVRKDAGDDPDVTHGSPVRASVQFTAHGDVAFRAGPGVGIVTKRGLSVPPGEPAINPGPREMIRRAVREITSRPIVVTVSIPGGEVLAEQTFNPRLGIEGGLSILGTTGRVRPFSCRALRCAISCAFSVAREAGVTTPVLAPGNIGEKSARRFLRLDDEQVISVGNEWETAFACLRDLPATGVLLWGHPGKLAKLALGIWDTHSARSPSAVEALRRLFPECRFEDVPTAEAFFAGWDSTRRRAYAQRTAQAIAERVAGVLPSSLKIAVGLIDLRGDVLGCYGAMSLWPTIRTFE
ncbi:MAG: cobalamin biosynthesis protein CbiD [Planctomycetota bacterium]|nr:MAG: cobalamin biosynthesis protein CbiD [Planctomycetota bacterium]